MTRRPQQPKPRSRPTRKTRSAGKTAKRAKPVAAKRIAAKSIATRFGPGDDFITAGARALGLAIDPAWMPAVRGHLEVTLRHGTAVADFPLPDETEPAPVFKA